MINIGSGQQSPKYCTSRVSYFGIRQVFLSDFLAQFSNFFSKNYFIFGNLFYFQKIGRKIGLGYFLNPKMCCPTALVQTMNDSFCCIVMSVGIKELVIKIFYSLNLQTEGSKSDLSLVLMSDQMFVVDSYIHR